MTKLETSEEVTVTPDEDNAKNKCPEMSKKSYCISSAIALPLRQYSSINQENTLDSWLLPWEGKKRVECTSNIPGLPEGLVTVLPD